MATTRVNKPTSSNHPPKNSVQPAKKASKAGNGKPNPQSLLPNQETTSGNAPIAAKSDSGSPLMPNLLYPAIIITGARIKRKSNAGIPEAICVFVTNFWLDFINVIPTS